MRAVPSTHLKKYTDPKNTSKTIVFT